MIDDENIAASWWRWWTNPCEGMHPDKVQWLKAQGIEWADRPEPSLIIKIRRLMNLSCLPDNHMTATPTRVVLGLVDHAEMESELSQFACLVLDDSILTARPSDWEQLHGVHNTEVIRDLISTFRTLSPGLETIRINIVTSLQRVQSEAVKINQAILIVLGLYLRKFSPVFYQRWLLGVSDQVAAYIHEVPLLSRDDLLQEFESWIDPAIEKIIGNFVQQFEIPLLDLNEA